MGQPLGSAQVSSGAAAVLWPQPIMWSLPGGPACLSISQDSSGHQLNWNFYMWREGLLWPEKPGHDLLLERPMARDSSNQ